jgi:hypothetical protein
MPRRKPMPMRMSIAMTLDDYELIRRAADKEGAQYTVWARTILLHIARQVMAPKRKEATP